MSAQIKNQTLLSLINNTGFLGALVCVRHTMFAEVPCMSGYPSVVHRTHGTETGFVNRTIGKG